MNTKFVAKTVSMDASCWMSVLAALHSHLEQEAKGNAEIGYAYAPTIQLLETKIGEFMRHYANPEQLSKFADSELEIKLLNYQWDLLLDGLSKWENSNEVRKIIAHHIRSQLSKTEQTTTTA